MSGTDQLGEPSYPPTPLRLAEARRQGLVARSFDLSGAVVVLGSLAILAIAGDSLLASLRDMTASMLVAGLTPLDADPYGQAARKALLPVVRAGAGVCVGIAAIAAAVNLLQVGFNVTPEPICPRLPYGPLRGCGRMFAARSMFRLLMTAAKIAAVAIAAVIVFRRELPRIVATGGADGASGMLSAAGRLAAWVGGALVALGTLDYLYQRWQLRQDLRMTRREVQEEARRLEGDARLRSSRRQAARRGAARTLPGRTNR